MLFNTHIFFVFLVVFLLFYGFVFLSHKPRIYFVLVSSLVFYGTWNYHFIPLLEGSTVIDYFLAQAIGRAILIGLKIPLNFRLPYFAFHRCSSGSAGTFHCPLGCAITCTFPWVANTTASAM